MKRQSRTAEPLIKGIRRQGVAGALTRTVALVLAACLLSFSFDVTVGQGPAEAKANCGGKNERACKVWERVPSCDKGLVEKKGKCVKKKKKKAPKCGGDGERVCKVHERIPACKEDLASKGGKCHECGGDGEMECPVTIQFPSCDKGLRAYKGECVQCGGEGERVCPVTVKFPAACDKGLMSHGGRCHECGAEGEFACPFTVRLKACDENLMVKRGKCIWRTAIPDDPFRIYNQSDKKVYYSVALSSDTSGRIVMIDDGTIEPGESEKIVLGGNDCYTNRTTEQETNAAFAFLGTREDSCRGKSFNVFFWSTKKNYDTYQGSLALADLVTAAFAEMTGSDVIGELLYGAYLDWVYDQANTSKGLLSKFGVTHLALEITQENRWIGFWSAKEPLDIGVASKDPGKPGSMVSPCSRGVGQVAAVDDEGRQLWVNGGCGGIPSPGSR